MVPNPTIQLSIKVCIIAHTMHRMFHPQPDIALLATRACAEADAAYVQLASPRRPCRRQFVRSPRCHAGCTHGRIPDNTYSIYIGICAATAQTPTGDRNPHTRLGTKRFQTGWAVNQGLGLGPEGAGHISLFPSCPISANTRLSADGGRVGVISKRRMTDRLTD